MIIDHLLELANKQSLTAAAASTNTLDFVQEKPTTGMDALELTMIVCVKEAVTGTLKVSIQDCDTENGTYADVVAGATLTAPAAGTMIALPMPTKHKRYVRAYFGGAPTAGKVTAFVTHGYDDNEPFKRAESIQGLYK